MKWLKLDTDNLSDEKVEELLSVCGPEGYGIYIACVSLIASKLTEDNPTVELKHTSALIAHKLYTTAEKVEAVIDTCIRLKLFTKPNGYVECTALWKRVDDNTKKSLRSKSGVTPESLRPEEKRREENRSEQKREEKVAASAAIVKTDPLYHRVEKAFLSKNDGKFDDYAKEGVCIHAIVKKAKARSPGDPGAMLSAMLNAFWKLKTGDTSAKGFWRGQPFLPSALSPLWSRVLETMRNDEVDPELLAIVNGGAA